MALLAGPPRRDENKEEVVALVRRRLCLVPQSPYTTSVTQEPSEGTPNCCLRARILDSVLSGSSKRRPYFHTRATPKGWKLGGGRRFGPTSALLGATEPVHHQCDVGAFRGHPKLLP